MDKILRTQHQELKIMKILRTQHSRTDKIPTYSIAFRIQVGFVYRVVENDEIPLIFDLLVGRIPVVNIPPLEANVQDLFRSFKILIKRSVQYM